MESYLIITFLLYCSVQTCCGQVFFSTLPRTLVVTTSPQETQVLNAGEDSILVSWGLNQSLQAAGTDDSYENLELKLCFAPVSQVDRAWRKTVDNLSKDKTCQFTVFKTTYDPSLRIRNHSFEWRIEKDVPTATYFVRAYAYNSAGEEVAYGQVRPDSKKTSNLFIIQAVSGRHASLEIASACFSAFAIVSLIGFFFIENRKNKGSSTI